MHHSPVAAPLLLALACASARPAPSYAAPTPPPPPPPCRHASIAALERDPALDAEVATRRYRLGQPASPRVTPDGRTVVFLQSGPRSDARSLWAFDVASGKARQLATAESLSGGGDRPPTAREAAERERMRLSARGIGTFVLSPDGRTAAVPLGGRLYLVDVASGHASALPAGSGPDADPQFSPDGRMVASIENDEIWVHEAGDRAVRRVTRGAGHGVTHGEAEFVAEEEMDRFRGFWWSPDGRQIAYEEADASHVENFFLSDIAHGEQAPAQSPYPRPGKANVAVRLGVVSRFGGRTRWIDWDHARYPYLARVAWPKGGPLLIEVETRDQKTVVLLAADGANGRTRTLVTEEDPAWVDLNDDLRPLASGQFLWSSEKSGQAELELRAADGSLVRTLTTPAIGFRRLVTLDGDTAVVEGGPDSTVQFLWRVPLAGGTPALLAGGPMVHEATGTKDAPVLVDHESRLDAPARTVLRRIADGEIVATLPDRAEQPPEPNAEILQLPGPMGPLMAEVIVPHRFDPRRRYPVVDWVYGGPGFAEVQRDEEGSALAQWLADQGVVVVKIDNRGTPRRGRAWERAIAGSFAGVPLGDQIAGLTALAAMRPFLDLSRVGIIGASFGGYLAALAVLRRPDVFKAAVAIAPVVTWEDYDTHYTERYLGTPEQNPEGYRENSLLTGAASLSRPLLLVHGTADDNVHVIGTLKLVSALEAAGHVPDLMLIPGQTHMFAEQATQRLMWAKAAAFLLDHLRE